MSQNLGFSQRLRMAIAKSGLKKGTVAKAVGLTPRSLSRYLSGDRVPHEAVLRALADILGVPTSSLLDAPAKSTDLLIALRDVASQPVARESGPIYLPDAVALTGLDVEERQTMLRMLDALQSGDAEIRRHLIGQLKIIEVALNTRRKQPRKEQEGGS